MTLSDVLNVVSDDCVINVSEPLPEFMSEPFHSIKRHYFGEVRNFKRLPEDFIASRVTDFGVFEGHLSIGISQYSGDFKIQTFTLSDALKLLPLDFCCSINLGMVFGEAGDLLKFLSPEILGSAVSELSLVVGDCFDFALGES